MCFVLFKNNCGFFQPELDLIDILVIKSTLHNNINILNNSKTET